jgi:addiction module HigA family antidote
MIMHNPPHPGHFIFEVYLKPYNLSIRKIAEKLHVSPSTFSRLINGDSNISSEMALRLSKALGRTPESWLSMQDHYDLWHTRKKLNLKKIQKIELVAT